MAEGIHNSLVVVDQALGSCSLIELIADVDTLNIVDECGRSLRTKGRCLVLIHIGVDKVAKVVPGGSLSQIRHKGIDGAAGGIHIAVEDRAQSVEAALTGACAPDHALDLAVIFDPAQFHSVCAIVDHDNIVEVGGDQIDHILLGLGQLQVMLTSFKIIVAVACIVSDLRHIGGQVSALTANAGDDDHCGVRESLCVVQQIVAVLSSFRLGQSPVLSPHTNHRAVCTIISVELAQLGVQLKTGVLQTFQQGNGGICVGQSAGTGAAVAGIGGSPAEHVQLAVLCQRQGAVVVQQNDTFVCQIFDQLSSLSSMLLADLAVAGCQRDHGVHGAGEDQVQGDGQCQHDAQTRLPADHVLFGFLHLAASDHCHNSHQRHNTKADQIALDGVQDVDDVIHIDGQHSLFLLLSYRIVP